jgi:hypothetical protein
MDDPTKTAFAFASDLTKQLITAASAIVTVTVTFSKDTPAAARTWAYSAWAAFLLSILLGVGALMSMTGELQPKNGNGVGTNNPSIWKKNITAFSGAQIIVFLIAISLTAWFGRIAMESSKTEVQPPAPVCNCIVSQPQAAPAPAAQPSGAAKR